MSVRNTGQRIAPTRRVHDDGRCLDVQLGQLPRDLEGALRVLPLTEEVVMERHPVLHDAHPLACESRDRLVGVIEHGGVRGHDDVRRARALEHVRDRDWGIADGDGERGVPGFEETEEGANVGDRVYAEGVPDVNRTKGWVEGKRGYAPALASTAMTGGVEPALGEALIRAAAKRAARFIATAAVA